MTTTDGKRCKGFRHTAVIFRERKKKRERINCSSVDNWKLHRVVCGGESVTESPATFTAGKLRNHRLS